MCWWIEHPESRMAGFTKSKCQSETRAYANVIERLDNMTYFDRGRNIVSFERTI